MSSSRRLAPANGVWLRRMFGLGAAVVVAAGVVVATVRAPAIDVDYFGMVFILALVGAPHLSDRWWPPRTSRLVWRRRVVGQHTVEPGLVAYRSLAGWVGWLIGLAWVVAGTLVAMDLLPDDHSWGRFAEVVLLGALAVTVGWQVYEELRFSGRMALTPGGIRYGRRTVDWANIDRVTPHREGGRVNGVRLRLVRRESLEPAPVVGGRDTAVPEEWLVAAIEAYRAQPEALAYGPVTPPEPTVERAGG